MTSLQAWRDRAVPRSFIDDVWSVFDESDFARFNTRNNLLSVACDVSETKEDFILTFDVPGLSKDDINIEIKGNQLVVSGERHEEAKQETERTYRIERNYGKFQRNFELPEGVDFDSVDAAYENGVLRISVPKGEIGKTRKVKISDSSKGFLKKLTTKNSSSPKSAAS